MWQHCNNAWKYHGKPTRVSECGVILKTFIDFTTVPTCWCIRCNCFYYFSQIRFTHTNYLRQIDFRALWQPDDEARASFEWKNWGGRSQASGRLAATLRRIPSHYCHSLFRKRWQPFVARLPTFDRDENERPQRWFDFEGKAFLAIRSYLQIRVVYWQLNQLGVPLATTQKNEMRVVETTHRQLADAVGGLRRTRAEWNLTPKACPGAQYRCHVLRGLVFAWGLT